MCQLFVRTGITFTHHQQALAHIGQVMLEKDVVHASYPAALLAREAQYPTGIALENHAVAIPHCEAEHTKSPAIYLIRPRSPVLFQCADDDKDIAALLIIALIMKNPHAQLRLLRSLFTVLQDSHIVDDLIKVKSTVLGLLFQQKIQADDYCIENL